MKQAIFLKNYLSSHIPLSTAMGIEVDFASSQKIILSAPLSNNINHKQTVFGGSLHSVTTLACWSLMHVYLQENDYKNVQIVITHSEISYLAPVTSDFKAICYANATLEWNKFEKILQKKGKARLNLFASISQGEQVCVNYSGIFAAIQTIA